MPSSQIMGTSLGKDVGITVTSTDGSLTVTGTNRMAPWTEQSGIKTKNWLSAKVTLCCIFQNLFHLCCYLLCRFHCILCVLDISMELLYFVPVTWSSISAVHHLLMSLLHVSGCVLEQIPGTDFHSLYVNGCYVIVIAFISTVNFCIRTSAIHSIICFLYKTGQLEAVNMASFCHCQWIN